MKAIGVVRRIDDLGRVVIPKEIRKTLKIKDGDSVEIFDDRENIIFQMNLVVGQQQHHRDKRHKHHSQEQFEKFRK